MLFTGTDDGVVQFSLDGGANWRKSENPPGLPDYGSYGVYVQRLQASKIDENVVYSLYENTKNGDFKPYIYKSTNRGGSWTSIAGDLPANGPVLAFAEDHVNPNLLFVGTEFGLFFTVDGGKKWIRLRTNLPTIPVRDLAIQERENDLVLATFGRGFYVLDDYSPLRQLTADVFQKDGHIFPAKSAVIEVPETGKARGFQGEQHWMAENPPDGAVITYWIRESPRTRRQRRQDAARAADQKKAPPAYPSQADITAEEDEEAPQTFLTISDAAGKVVRRLVVPGGRGIHRFTWNLRGVPATLPGAGGPGGGGGGGGGGGQGAGAGGPFVPPGTYRAALSRRADGTVTVLGEAQTITVSADPGVTLTPAARTAAIEYQDKVAKLQRTFTGALEQANNMKTRTTAIRRAIADSTADADALAQEGKGEHRAEHLALERRAEVRVGRVADPQHAAHVEQVDDVAGRQPLGQVAGVAEERLAVAEGAGEDVAALAPAPCARSAARAGCRCSCRCAPAPRRPSPRCRGSRRPAAPRAGSAQARVTEEILSRMDGAHLRRPRRRRRALPARRVCAWRRPGVEHPGQGGDAREAAGVGGGPLAGGLAVDAARRGEQREGRATPLRRTTCPARKRSRTSPVTRSCERRSSASMSRQTGRGAAPRAPGRRRRAATVSLTRSWRPVRASFSSSRWAVSRTSAAGASKATRPLMPRIVSPRWMPRPMPCGAASASSRSISATGASGSPSSAAGTPALEGEAVARRRRRRVEGAARQHPRRFGQRLDGVERLAPADRHAPEAAVDRVGGAERRHGQAARFEVSDLLGARARLVAHRRQHLQARERACAAPPRSAPGRCPPPCSRGRPCGCPAAPRRAPPPAPAPRARRRRRAGRPARAARCP